MLEPFNPSWHRGVAALRDRFDRQQVDQVVANIIKGRLPEDFYALARNATVLALGFGCGVRILRLASWGGDRVVICVEPDPLVRVDAGATLRTCSARGVTLVDGIRASMLEAGAHVDLLLVEPRYAYSSAILEILTRYRVTAVVGSYDPTLCSDAEIYRICSDRASRFNVQSVRSDNRLIGRRRAGPDVSVIVVVEQVGGDLARTLQSLREQSNLDLEVLLAPVGKAAQVQGDDLPAADVPASGTLRLQSWLPSVPAALAAVQGSYVALVAAGDVCDPSMFGSMFEEAAPGREDIALCAYRKVKYSDGAVQLRYTIGQRELDLRVGSRVCAPGTLDGLDLQPTIGRCLYRRGFLQAVAPVWDDALGAFAATVFQAQCLFAAGRIVTMGSAYLEHWETVAEMTGQRYRLAGVPMVRQIFAALSSRLLARDDNYGRELDLRRLLARFYLSLYGQQTRARGRWAVISAMVSDCLAPMRFGSQTEFALRGLRRLFRR